MGWNRMSSRSVAAQSWLNVIDVDRDRLCERLCGYGLGLFLVKGCHSLRNKEQKQNGQI